VFLLAGPATNVASLTVLTRVLGRRGVVIYLGSIAIFAVLFGLATDWLYAFLGIALQTRLTTSTSELLPGWLHLTIAAVLAVLMLSFFVRSSYLFFRSKIKANPLFHS
jgi:hypothetical protein